MPKREVIETDVLIVGAGPAGLSAACRLGQIAKKNNEKIDICVLEKGSEVGAHLISGAVLEPSALNELFPDWKDMQPPTMTPVTKDTIYYATSARSAIAIPKLFHPRTMHNKGNYIISIGEFCRWLAKLAEDLGVDILPGFSAASLIYENSAVKGVITADMGIDAKGNQRPNFEAGVEIRAKYTLLAEGARGHLGKEVIERYRLDEHSYPPHYSLGIKEVWEIDNKAYKPGKVIHTIGWPLSSTNTNGGGFLYHAANNQVFVGLITDLDYSNPYLSPYNEFQRYKHHPVISRYLKNGKRISYGARVISKGGWNAMPMPHFPGGLLIGCNAGTLDVAKIKGIHMAMQSGKIAAESVKTALEKAEFSDTVKEYTMNFVKSPAGKQLAKVRNIPLIQKRYSTFFAAVRIYLEIHVLGIMNRFIKDKHPRQDRECTQPAKQHRSISYPKPDGILSFDTNSSVFLSNTNHAENQPCHLQLKDPKIPISKCLPAYAEPAQRYCPAGVYEVLKDKNNKAYFQINAQNCVHCKTCDIKDPYNNIHWAPPESGGGPNYTNM